jgi:hypothetical protein
MFIGRELRFYNLRCRTWDRSNLKLQSMDLISARALGMFRLVTQQPSTCRKHPNAKSGVRKGVRHYSLYIGEGNARSSFNLDFQNVECHVY